MKLLIIIVTTLMMVSTDLTGLNAQEAVKEKGAVKKVEGKEIGTHDWLASFWAKVAKVGKKGTTAVPTSVAGLRGAEQEKGKELTPYWKGKEKSKDGAAMAKVEALINKKDFAGAIEELKSFGQSYPDSPLKPVAALSLAYAYAQAGKTDDARSTFENFLKTYPDHELATDAKAGIELLKGENK